MGASLSLVMWINLLIFAVMIYTYDKQAITFKNVTKELILIFIGVVFFFSFFSSIIIFAAISDGKLITQETKAIIINEATKANEFSPNKLKAYILELNIRYPHIVYAQARLETGNFQSDLYKTNKNLFGMKVAKHRPTTNKGGDNGYAYYNLWRESVEDYGFFQACYLNDIKTENEYYEYLKQNYAKENPNYVTQIKLLVSEANDLTINK